MEKWELLRSLCHRLDLWYPLYSQMYNQLDESLSNQLSQLQDRFDRRFDEDNWNEYFFNMYLFVDDEVEHEEYKKQEMGHI